MNRKGFTLIELLVVIAIIVILAAILFPVFARARENARRSSCQSNLKQLALGVAQYTQDYDESFPFIRDYTSSTTGYRGFWSKWIMPYVKSEQIFDCPSVSGTVAPLNEFSEGYFDYGANSGLLYEANFNSVKRLSQLEKPAEMPMLGDNNRTASTAELNTGKFFIHRPSDGVTQYMNLVGDRHLETCNLAFADGHVKSFKMNKLSTLVWVLP